MKTIFEYAPDSRGSQDYRRLVESVVDFYDKPEVANARQAQPDSVPPTDLVSDLVEGSHSESHI